MASLFPFLASSESFHPNHSHPQSSTPQSLFGLLICLLFQIRPHPFSAITQLATVCPFKQQSDSPSLFYYYSVWVFNVYMFTVSQLRLRGANGHVACRLLHYSCSFIVRCSTSTAVDCTAVRGLIDLLDTSSCRWRIELIFSIWYNSPTVISDFDMCVFFLST